MQLLENNYDMGMNTQSDEMGQPIEPIQQRNIQSTLSSMNIIDNLDKTLDTVFKSVVKNSNSFKTLDDQIQRFEIEDFSKSLNKAKFNYGGVATKHLTEEELETRDFLNANANNLLDGVGANDFSVSGDRKKRYETYREIPGSNYIAGNMYDVFIQNIFVKNMQNKEFLFLKKDEKKLKNNDNDENSPHYEALIKTFISYYELEKKLQNFIVPNTLTYGNYFIEVINLKKLEDFINNSTLLLEDTNTIRKTYKEKLELKYGSDFGKLNESFVFESLDYNNVTGDKPILLENAFLPKKDEDIKEDTNFVNKLKDFLKENRPTSLIEDNDIFSFFDQKMKDDKATNLEDYKFDDIIQLELESLKDIQLKGIPAQNVIIVEDETILYGYLIIEDEGKKSNDSDVNILQRFLSDGTQTKANGSESQKDTIDKMTKYILDNINELIRLGKNRGGFEFKDLNLPQDSLASIKTIIYNKIKEKSKLKFRFLSSNNLINFSAPVNKYAPYGTSIFDPVVQPVKLYNLAMISSIISRLSRASVIRKWNVEAGSKKNHAEIIESVKKDLKNKSISFDNLSNIKNIANVLTDFRDIATIKIDGQSFIDMEIVPVGDRSLPLNDLDALKADLVSSTGVPAVYLNIADAAELREHLVNINTSFAQKIMLWQNNIEDGLDRIINILFTELLQNNNKKNNSFSINSYYKLKLIAPLVLQIQSNEALITSITNIIGLFKSAEFIIDPKELYKTYIPNMDWDALEESGKKYIQSKAKDMLMDGNANGGQPGQGF